MSDLDVTTGTVCMGNDNVMSFNGLVSLVARRWYVALLGLIGTFLLAILASTHVAPRYETNASVVLLPPRAVIGLGGNPYLSMGGLDAAADVTASSLSSPDVQDRVAKVGATSTVVRDGNTAAPILLITADGRSAQSSIAALRILIASVPHSLAAMQASADVKTEALVSSKLIAASTGPSVSHNPQLRATLIALFVGLGATLILTTMVDRLARPRRRRLKTHARPRMPAGHGDPPVTPDLDPIEHEFALTDRRG